MSEFSHLIEFTVKPDFIGEFKQACQEMKKHAMHEDGLIEMKLYQDENDKQIVFIFTRWMNPDAFNQHKEKDYSKVLYKLEEKVLKTKPKSFMLEASAAGTQQQPKPIAVEDKPITMFFILKFNVDYREQLIDAFSEHIPKTRQENGNILMDMFTIENIDDEMIVYAIWRSSDDLWDIHMHQPYSQKVGEIMMKAVSGNMEDYVFYLTEF